MSIVYIDFDKAKKKFYQYECHFNGFKGVDETKLQRIDVLVEEYKRKYVMNNTSYIPMYSDTQQYGRLLAHLANRKDIKWDEKMLFIIRYYDPELKLLQLYLQTFNIDPELIKNEDNDYIKADLLEYKTNIDLEFEKQCRSLIKIYDPNIIKYEKKLSRVLQSEKLKFGVKKDYLKLFFTTYITADTNLKITDEELTSIISEAREYKRKYGLPSINDLAFQLIEQPRLIGIKTARKAMIFMIYILDEQFKAFHFYDEYGNWNDIQKMCFLELGFYNIDFVKNEVRFDRENHDTSTTLSLFPDPRINN